MKPEQLKSARAKLKMTQPEIARELEMGERTYLQRERDEMPIGKTMEYAICWMLHRAGLDSLIKRLGLGKPGEK